MEKMWLEQYDDGVPTTLQPYSDQTLLDVIAQIASARPNHQALHFKGAWVSYGQLEKQSDAFAAALTSLGVVKGDRVALILPNCPQFIIAQVATWKIGGIVAAINPLYTPRELVHALNECGATSVVTLTMFYEKVRAIQHSTELKTIIATNIKDCLARLARVLFTLLVERKAGHHAKLQPKDHWFVDLILSHKMAPRPQAQITPADPAQILFTGGTSGLSKAAVCTHKSIMAAGKQGIAWSGDLIEEWKETTMMTLPLFHVFGGIYLQSMMLNSYGTMVLVPNPRDLDDVIKTIRQRKPTFLPGVPALFEAILNHPAVKSNKLDLSSLKLCVSGATALMAKTKQRFEAATGSRIVEGYGLTETTGAICMGPINGVFKEGSVGVPLPDVSVRIVNADDPEREMPTKEVGEIIIQAPQLMREYWQRPEETSETIIDGWLFTGDLGYMDEDGFLFIVDRKKDVIKTSGFQVWPSEVEEVIQSHPAVREVGVVGVPDERQTEAVKAWIVPDGDRKLTAEEIHAFCRKSLAAYKVPRHIEFIDELPKTMIGKVLRRELKQRD